MGTVSENLSTIQANYVAFTKGDIPTVLDSLAPDAVWHEPEGFMYSGDYQGTDAILKGVFMRLGTEWDGWQAIAEEFIDGGDTIITLGHYSATYKETGKSFVSPFVHVWKFKDGQVVDFRTHMDTAVVERATHA